MPSKKSLLPWILLIVLSLIWGSSFILMKKSLFNETGTSLFSANQLASLRLLIAGLVLLPFSWKQLFKLKKKELFFLSLVALFGNAIPSFMFAIAQTKLDSGYIGMLNSLTPIFTFIISIIAFNQKSKKHQIIGLTIGLVGTIGLLSLSLKGDANNWIYSILAIIASVCYGISVNVIHQKLAHISSLTIASVALLMAAIPAGFYVATTDLQSVMQVDQANRGLLFIVTLSVLGTALALVLFNKLVQMTNAVRATSVTYIIPMVAVFWAILDGEKLTWKHLIFGAIILLGVYLVNKKKKNLTEKN